MKNISTEAKVMTSIIVISLLILVGGSIYYSKNAAKPAADLDKNDPTLLGGMENIKKATGEEKVVMVEYGDFECPACKAVYPYAEDLVEKYKENLTFEFRTFPIHGHSVLASRAAWAAKEISNDPMMFFKFGDLLFDKQDEWSTESGATNQIDLFAGYATSLGLDGNKMKAILQSDKYEAEVKKDESDAEALGTRVTPTFYINGKIVEGGKIADIEAIIKEEIQK